MHTLTIVFDALRTFLNTGGDVLWGILLVSILLWYLIADRLLFFRFDYPEQRDKLLQQWASRTDKISPQALHIRKCIISQAKVRMSKTLLIIKMLIALCPLMGLLGTVLGMIHVFDVMAVTGTGNVRAMSSGISQATIPTMAGMIIAIAGLYFSRIIEERIDAETHHLADFLTYN